MDARPFEQLDFALGWCAGCAREVLTHTDYGAEGAEQRRCVHCDHPVEAGVRRARGSELAEHGYGLVEASGCGKSNCGGGRCGQG